MSGSSTGGLAAAFAGVRRPDVFGHVLCQSGALWWKPADDPELEWLARQVAARPLSLQRWHLEAGAFEVSGEDASILLSTRHLRTVLRAKGYPVHYAEFSGGHTYLCWRGTLADGLIALLGKDARWNVE